MDENVVEPVQPNVVAPQQTWFQSMTNPVGTPEVEPPVDMSWAEEGLPGYTLEEALALSAAGLHSSNDQLSVYAKQQTLNELILWLQNGKDDKIDKRRIRAKHLLMQRRMHIGEDLANRVVEGSVFDQW